MNRRAYALVFLGAAFALCLAANLAVADEKNDKPKGAPTLDDRTLMLTETVDGKEKTSKVDLKYNLKVKGFFDKDGLHLEEVDEDGPAFKLSNNDGATVMLEKGDIIKEIDGKAIKSAADYVKALNDASDHSKVKVKVKDVRTGDDQDLVADTNKI
jgi:S1-C subfamily serine protease